MGVEGCDGEGVGVEGVGVEGCDGEGVESQLSPPLPSLPFLTSHP